MWPAGLRLLVYAYVSLRLLDDTALLLRIFNLGMLSVLPRRDGSLCSLCDEIMSQGLIPGADGIDALPCSWLCLRVSPCVRMCERVKEVSRTSAEFPCIAAGYCVDPDRDVTLTEALTVDGCHVAPPFRCVPSEQCRLRRQGLGFSCELRPGLGRWIGMRDGVRRHAALVVDALYAQPRCGELNERDLSAGAARWCIASPRGLGAVAESAGLAIALGYGGLQTVRALETPGGDDDRQWLTYWAMLALLTTLEQWARVLLSRVPRYYELKLLLLLYLVHSHGSERLYRVVRRHLRAALSLIGARRLRRRLFAAGAKAELAALPQELREAQRARRRRRLHWRRRRSAASDVVGARGGGDGGAARAGESSEEGEGGDAAGEAEEELRSTYLWLATSDGLKALELCAASEARRRDLQLKAAEAASFQPRYVIVHIYGVCDGAEHPPVDGPGRADAYCTLRLVSASGEEVGSAASSRVCYRTTAPAWRQTLELPLAGGTMRAGFFRNEHAASLRLRVDVMDAQVGPMGWLLNVSQLAAALFACGLGAAWASGFTDTWSRERLSGLRAAAVAIGAAAAAGLLAHVRLRVDDRAIGTAECDLAPCLDQNVHEVHLPLEPLEPSASTTLQDQVQPAQAASLSGRLASGASKAPGVRNAHGQLGVLRIAVHYSET